jgi:hypothetical protein
VRRKRLGLDKDLAEGISSEVNYQFPRVSLKEGIDEEPLEVYKEFIDVSRTFNSDIRELLYSKSF